MNPQLKQTRQSGIVTLTQSQYDALATKDPNIDYAIIDDKITIEFDPNGGTFPEDQLARQEFYPGQSLSQDPRQNGPTPVRPGYVFLGWTKLHNQSDNYFVGRVPRSSTKYFAVWTLASVGGLQTEWTHTTEYDGWDDIYTVNWSGVASLSDPTGKSLIKIKLYLDYADPDTVTDYGGGYDIELTETLPNGRVVLTDNTLGASFFDPVSRTYKVVTINDYEYELKNGLWEVHTAPHDGTVFRFYSSSDGAAVNRVYFGPGTGTIYYYGGRNPSEIKTTTLTVASGATGYKDFTIEGNLTIKAVGTWTFMSTGLDSSTSNIKLGHDALAAVPDYAATSTRTYGFSGEMWLTRINLAKATSVAATYLFAGAGFENWSDNPAIVNMPAATGATPLGSAAFNGGYGSVIVLLPKATGLSSSTNLFTQGTEGRWGDTEVYIGGKTTSAITGLTGKYWGATAMIKFYGSDGIYNAYYVDINGLHSDSDRYLVVGGVIYPIPDGYVKFVKGDPTVDYEWDWSDPAPTSHLDGWVVLKPDYDQALNLVTGQTSHAIGC